MSELLCTPCGIFLTIQLYKTAANETRNGVTENDDPH